MAATGYTPISLYYSTTASAVPTAGNLANGELALNIADMKLYAKNSSGTVTLLASNASTTGVDSLSFGSTGLTPSTATTGAITVAGTLNVANGGTGQTSFTAGTVLYGNGTSGVSASSNLYFDGSNGVLGVGTSSPVTTVRMTIEGATQLRLRNTTTRYRADLQANSSGLLVASYDDTGAVYMPVSLDGSILSFRISASEKGRFDASGNFGVGTTTPINNSGYGGISLNGTSGALFSMLTNGTETSRIASLGDQTSLQCRATSGYITFVQGVSGGTERGRFDTAGNFIVGSSTNTRVQIYGGGGVQAVAETYSTESYPRWYIGRDAGNAGGPGFVLNPSGADPLANAAQMSSPASKTISWSYANGSGWTESMRISNNGGFSVGTTANPGAGAIYATGNITAYYSSDIKFKENVRDIPDALATANAIGGKLFDWTDEYIESKGGADGYFVQKADFGVVAQDVQKVFPIAVRTRPDGSLAVDYEKLGALAFAAVGELTTLVQAMTARVEALETN